MVKMNGLMLAAAGLLVLVVGCKSSGAGGREITIVQKADVCTPASIAVKPGEKLKLVVKNESGKDYEIEGIDGTKLEEVVVPEGRTRTPGYTVPDGAGTHKLKCYIPGGVSTIIELIASEGQTHSDSSPPPTSAATTAPVASDGGASDADKIAQATLAAGPADTAVAVTLVEYSVTPDKPSVKAGVIRFIATNVSKDQVHELAVLKVKPDGSVDNLGEIESIAAQQGGAVTLKLAAGAYRLACLITAGESGSAVDHYQQGMHTEFKVE